MKTKKLVTTAMLISLGTILSVLTVFVLPFGGSVTPASMVPIVLISYLYGTKWGLFSAFVYSLLQMITGMGTVSAFFLPGDSQMALGAAITICFIDYIAAYTCLGFAGMFKNRFKGRCCELVLGVLFACTLRYIMHIISGAVFFGAWAQWFFGDASGLAGIPLFKDFCKMIMTNISGTSLSIVYSVIYNGAYMIPEIIITAVCAPFVYKVIQRR